MSPPQESAQHDQIPAIGPQAAGASPVDLQQAVDDALAALDTPSALTLVVNDPQRHTDTRSVLQAVTQRVEPRNIRLLVATGSHLIPELQRRKFVGDLSAGLGLGEIAWHDCRSKDLVDIGGLWRGHRWLAAGPPLLAVGSVEPHYFAGFTGAHKTLTIGCAAYEDIERNHAGALTARCRPCVLSGNPVYQGVLDMLAGLASTRPLAAVNLVQAGRRILSADGGPVTASLRAAVATAQRVFVSRIESPAEALILEVSAPLSASFYQADKGIKNNEWAVRDGGALVLVAACGDGLGQAQFADLLLQADSHADAARIVDHRGYRLGDHKAVRLRYLTDPTCRGVKVYIVSDGISTADAATLGATKVADVAAALADAGLMPGQEGLYRVLDAGNVCVLAGSDQAHNT